MTYFDRAILQVLSHEGGYTFDRRDPGGETNFGICKRQYPDLNIRALTKDDAIAIYKRDYWRGYYDKMPYQIAAKSFDQAVNMGHARANKLLQRALNVVEDGVIGEKTIAAANAQPVDQTLKNMIAEQLAVYEIIIAKRPECEAFRKGWANRAAWVPAP